MTSERDTPREEQNYITPEADSQSLATNSDKPEPILALGLTFRPKPSQARLHPARRPDRRLP
jgi:hypothetical protein